MNWNESVSNVYLSKLTVWMYVCNNQEYFGGQVTLL